MADLDITQMTQLAVAPAADDVIYIGDVSEAVLDDQNKHIEVQDLFEYLDGTVAVDITLNAVGILDMSSGTVHLNEAVDLTATSTELNQLDGVSVGGTSAGDVVTIDGTQTLTNKTLTTPTIGDLTNANHDHSNAAGGGTLSQTVYLSLVNAGTPVVAQEYRGIVVTPKLNGMDLTDATVGVWDKGAGTAMSVQVVRSRGGVEANMLSTAITVGDEWYASDGVVNTANDDVATGDLVIIQVTVLHGTTAANGLFATLEFS